MTDPILPAGRHVRAGFPRPIHLQMCRMAAAFFRVTGDQSEAGQPNAMVCAERPCTYPACRVGRDVPEAQT